MSEKHKLKPVINQAKDPVIDKILGVKNTGIAAIGTPAEDDFAQFKPSLMQTPIPAKSISSDLEEQLKAQSDKLEELKKNLAKVQEGMNGVKAVSNKAPVPKPLDYTQLSETAAFDYSIPIEAISFDLPAYLDVDLKDKNYIARWVNKNPARIGPMRIVGFVPVKPEHLAKNLALEITTDMNGNYSFIDVTLMMIHKSRYFAALRNNHMRSLLLTNPDKLHEINKVKADEYMNSLGPQATADWQYAGKAGVGGKPKMEVYI